MKKPQSIYTQVNNELSPLEFNPDAFRFATQKTFTVPELPFGFAVTTAEEILVNKLQREAAATEKVKFNERRAERWQTSQQQTAA